MNPIDEYPEENENRKPQASNYRAKLEDILPEKSDEKEQVTPTLRKSSEVKQNNSTSTSSFCQNHPEEENKYFCFDCLIPPLCSECVINGIHKTHNVQNIKKALPTVQGTLREYLQSLDSRASQINSLIQSFHSKLKEDEEQNKIYKTQVKSVFDELRHKLDQKEKEIYLSSDASINEWSQDLINYERQISNKLQNLQSNSNVINAQINGNNPLELLSFYSENYNLIIQLLEIDKKDKKESFPEAKAIIKSDTLRDLKSKASEIEVRIDNMNMDILNTRENPYQGQNKRISNQKSKNDRFGL